MDDQSAVQDGILSGRRTKCGTITRPLFLVQDKIWSTQRTKSGTITRPLFLDGYFYLSYYDMTIKVAESYEFETPEEDSRTSRSFIMEHDLMLAESYSSVLYDNPVYTANVFEAEGNCVLEDVSALTGDLNTKVEVSVYRVGDKAADPTDGLLIDTVSKTFPFAGYHRIKLSRNLVLKKGEKVAIVICNRVKAKDGTKYSLVNPVGTSLEGVPVYDEARRERGDYRHCYFVGKINPGESYVCYEDGTWADWADEIAAISTANDKCACLAYDNLSIKGYASPLSELKKVHDFGKWKSAPGGKAAVCSDCGYVLTKVDEPAKDAS